MGIFDKIRSVLSDLEKTGTSSNKSSVTPSATPSGTPGSAPSEAPSDTPTGAPGAIWLSEQEFRPIQAAGSPADAPGTTPAGASGGMWLSKQALRSIKPGSSPREMAAAISNIRKDPAAFDATSAPYSDIPANASAAPIRMGAEMNMRSAGNAPGGTPQSAAAPIGAPTGMAMQAQAKAAAEAHKRMIEAASDPTMPASRMGLGMMSMGGPGAMPSGMPSGMPGGMPGYMDAAPVMGMPMGSPGGMAGVGIMPMAKTDPFPWPGSVRPNIYAPGITIGEQVLLNEEGITVTALAYDINPAMDDFIKVKIENATDTPVTVICSNVIVNGYCVSPIGLQCLAAPQPAGKEKYESAALGVWKLEAAGLNAVGQIDFHLLIMCMTASGMNKIDKDVTIRTSAYDHMDKEIKDPGKELIVCDGVRVFSKYIGEGSAFPTSYATICLENNSGGKRVIFFNCCYHDGDSGQRIISSNMLLEDGNKSLFILPVTNVQSVENIEVDLQVTPPGILNLPKPEKLQIPLS